MSEINSEEHLLHPVHHDPEAPLIIDSFAGSGGASIGIHDALGIEPFLACNHCHHAMMMHKENSPKTYHLEEDIFTVQYPKFVGSRTCWLAWYSPSCVHHSRARGGRPKDTGLRGMAWVAAEHAATMDIDVIMLENVIEFEAWGPLLTEDYKVTLKNGKVKTIKAGQADPRRAGEDFRAFVARLRELGYVVEWRNLVAGDYGACTSRKRFFMIARKDGHPIVWPEPTHSKTGANGLPKWLKFSDFVEWDAPMKSIFDKKKPPAPNSCRRIAEGFRRYVVETDQPYIVAIDNASSSAANAWPIDQPLGTVVTENRFSLVAPSLTCVGYGERPGQAPRTNSLDQPLNTVVCTNKVQMTHVHLTKYRTGSVGRDLREPCPTITSGAGSDRPAGSPHALGLTGVNLAPMTKKGVAVLKHYGGVVGHKPDRPLGAVTCVDHHGVMEVNLEEITTTATPFGDHKNMLEAVLTPELAARWPKAARTYAFLTKFYGTGVAKPLNEPLDTITTKDRFMLVMIKGTVNAVTDIMTRMLTPRELARAQGFPDTYRLIGSKSDQVARIGNSVPPPVVSALVSANATPAVRRYVQRHKRQTPTQHGTLQNSHET